MSLLFAWLRRRQAPPQVRGDWWAQFEREFRAYAARTANARGETSDRTRSRNRHDDLTRAATLTIRQRVMAPATGSVEVGERIGCLADPDGEQSSMPATQSQEVPLTQISRTAGFSPGEALPRILEDLACPACGRPYSDIALPQLADNKILRFCDGCGAFITTLLSDAQARAIHRAQCPDPPTAVA